MKNKAETRGYLDSRRVETAFRLWNTDNDGRVSRDKLTNTLTRCALAIAASLHTSLRCSIYRSGQWVQLAQDCYLIGQAHHYDEWILL
jgi:tRNA threonylcarbamoyladenosine modification (KEOPS) complex  Pcc1 subunit